MAVIVISAKEYWSARRRRTLSLDGLDLGMPRGRAIRGLAERCQRQYDPRRSGTHVRFQEYSFGSIRIDGVTYAHDLIIDRGKIRKRKKAASKRFRDAYGHTPLSVVEDIPWRCHRLVIGTGADGALPVMREVEEEAHRRKVDLLIAPTAEAIKVLSARNVVPSAGTHSGRCGIALAPRQASRAPGRAG
jgi:hypothetical protein